MPLTLQTLLCKIETNTCWNMIRIKSSKWDIEEAARYFFLCFGLINIALVILISIYLIIAGLPAIFEVGFFDFIFGTKWASAAAEPQFGILPFILTSFYGTGGAIVLGLPLGFFCAVYLAKLAPAKVSRAVEPLIDLLAGIPSVVYGFVGMLVLVPLVQRVFNLPDGASLLAAILVLTIMILPSIIKVSITSLSGIASAVVLGVGRAIGEAMAVMMVAGNVPNMPGIFESVRFLTTAVASEMSYASGLQRDALFSIALVLFVFIMMINATLNLILKKGRS